MFDDKETLKARPVTRRDVGTNRPVTDELPACGHQVLQPVERRPDDELDAIGVNLDTVVRDVGLTDFPGDPCLSDESGEILVVLVDGALRHEQRTVDDNASRGAIVAEFTAERIVSSTLSLRPAVLTKVSVPWSTPATDNL